MRARVYPFDPERIHQAVEVGRLVTPGALEIEP